MFNFVRVYCYKYMHLVMLYGESEHLKQPLQMTTQEETLCTLKAGIIFTISK